MKKFLYFFCCPLVCFFVCLAFVNYAFIPPAYAEKTCIDLPVLMYHSILKSRQGKYIASPAQFENDIVALKNQGYNFVLPREVVAFVEGKNNLPQNPIILSFDDGHYNNLYYCLPILQKHNAKAIFNVIGKFSEIWSKDSCEADANFSHLSWTHIQQLSQSPLIEIGNHTYDMHNFNPRYGIGRMSGESLETYTQKLKNDVSKLQEKLLTLTGYMPTTFAYPFGKITTTGREVLQKLGFKMFLTCTEGISQIKKGEPNTLTYIKRINRSGNYTTSTVLKLINNYKTNCKTN